MKTLMIITATLVAGLATVLQQNSIYWSEQGEMSLAKMNLDASWWLVASCAVLSITVIFMLIAEVKRADK